MQLQTAMTKEKGDSRFVEFATIEDTAITRTQIEYCKGRVYMRAKKRVYVFT